MGKSLSWNNPTVSYEEVVCPSELSESIPCWEDNGNGYHPFGDIPETCLSRSAPEDSTTPAADDATPASSLRRSKPPTNAPVDQRATTTTASFCGVETDECTDTASNPCCDDYECTGYSPFYKSCTLKQDATCLGRWADCTNSIGGCCGGLNCVGNQFYRQCQKQTCGVDTDRCGDDS